MTNSTGINQKSFLLFVNLLFCISIVSAKKIKCIHTDSSINPLASYSKEWNNIKYKTCNTADSVDFLSDDEKKIIWVLNMVRMNPQLFLKTVLLNPKCQLYSAPQNRDSYFKSLMTSLQQMKPQLRVLVPERGAYESAYCHAKTSGEMGYVGHERKNNCQEDFYGECCDYGVHDPAMIVLHLLIDKDVPSLGHRIICLSPQYSQIGVSIQPHISYGVNAVLDFKF